MKKFLLVLLLAFVPLKAHAAITDPEVLQEKTVVIHYSTAVAAATTANFDLISLSTTTGLFPHLDRGEIDISHINVMVDKAATSTGTIRIGVATFVNSSTGTVSFFYTAPFSKNATNSSLPIPNNFSPAFYKCRVNSAKTAATTDIVGTTPFILTNDKNVESTAYQTDVLLASPAGFIFPSVGDIIMEIKNLDPSNTLTVYVDVWYHSER